MRAVRIIVVVAALVGLASTTPRWATAQPVKPPCAVPQGWRVLAQDRVAVVIVRQQIRLFHSPSGQSHEYCSRSGGRFHPIPVSGVTGECEGCQGPLPDQIRDLQLKGRYLAYDDSLRLGAAGHVVAVAGPNIWIVDTRTGRSRQGGDVGATSAHGSPTSAVELSENGVAARVATYLQRGGPITAVEVLTLFSSAWLDRDSVPGSITDVQLYGCAAGCAPQTTVVAWKHNGVRRYAEVTG